MHTQTVDSANQNPPTLFEGANQIAGLIVPEFEAERSLGQSHDLIQVLQKTADRAGFSYLFEVPGCLFDRIDFRVAAIRSCTGENNVDYYFILCHEADGISAVLEFDEAPLVAQDFFHSYAWVLSSLKELTVLKNLH